MCGITGPNALYLTRKEILIATITVMEVDGAEAMAVMAGMVMGTTVMVGATIGMLADAITGGMGMGGMDAIERAKLVHISKVRYGLLSL